MLVVAVSMIATPLMVKAGDRLAGRLRAMPTSEEAKPAADLDRHVVIVGYDEVGQLLDLLLEKENIPHVAFDRDINIVRQGRKSGRNVHFGDMYSAATQEAAGLGKAAAVYVTSRDMDHAKALAVTLHRLYSHMDVYVRVRTLGDQDELAAKGIKHAGTGYIERDWSIGLDFCSKVLCMEILIRAVTQKPGWPVPCESYSTTTRGRTPNSL